jgi:D-alanyl-D-alanine carboxypeptidase
MRKNRIILLGLLIALSLGAIKLLGQERIHSIGGQQTAIIKDAISATGDAVRPQIVGGDSADIVAQPVLDVASSNATSSEDQVCGSSIGARFGLVRYLNSDTTVFERNPEGRWPIASITKLMTAIVASEQGLLTKNITFTDAMTIAEGNAGNFKTGDVMIGSDILKGMLLASSNDAAEALSQTYGSDAFIALMNDKAKSLRMMDTTYFDPSGLSARNQSTSNDLYKLMSYLQSEHPELLAITRQKKVTVVELQTKRKRIIANIDVFAGQANFIGGKTGYITEAEGNGNLVTLFTHNNQPFMVVVLGSPDRFGETRKLLKCI